MTNRKTLTLSEVKSIINGVKGPKRNSTIPRRIIGVDRGKNGEMNCTVEMEKLRDGRIMINSITFSKEEVDAIPEYTLYEMLAARMFNVHLCDVTEEQKDEAKTAYFRYLYGGWDK